MKLMTASGATLLAAILLLIVTTLEAHQNECDGSDALAKLTSFSVVGCALEKNATCNFYPRERMLMRVEFETVAPFSSARLDLRTFQYADVNHFYSKSACGGIALKCPVEANKTKALSLLIPAPNFVSEGRVIMQVKLVDEQDKDIFCANFFVRLVQRPSVTG